MNTKGAAKLLLGAAIASAIGTSGSRALAQDAYQIETTYSGGGTASTYDNSSGAYPVVSDILTTPGTLDGYTYTRYVYLLADSTGSIEMYYSSSVSPYVPTIGDALSISSMPYDPFDGIPEGGGAGMTIALQSQGNAVAAPQLETIPQINVTALDDYNLVGPDPGTAGAFGGYLVTVDNVTLANGGTVWATHSNTQTYMSDQDGNSMILYQYASQYEQAAALGGTAVPTGLVDVTGFVDFYAPSSEAEFCPISITPVPEPSMLGLYGIGSVLGGLFCCRFRRIA